MKRNLATLQQIVNVTPINGADAIEQIQVMGWLLIAKKGEFQPGDWCVFFEIDSVLPETEWSEFLRSKAFRIKTMKLGKFGVISQGLALPVSILPDTISDAFTVGLDVTELLGVTNLRQGGYTLKPFPAGVPKTDEMRIQSAEWILDRMKGKAWYATLKYNGTSFTAVYRDDRLIVASRNCELEDDGNLYWTIAKKYDLENILKDSPGIVVQGEIVGPGVQKNPMGLAEHELYVFNVYDTRTGCYYSYEGLQGFCIDNGLLVADTMYAGFDFDLTIDQMQGLAQGNYEGTTHPREGLVFRPLTSEPDPILGQLSFKVINVDYLLKTGQ